MKKGSAPMVTNAYSFIKPGCWMLIYYFEGDTLFIGYKCVESDHPHCLTCCAAPIDCLHHSAAALICGCEDKENDND